MAKRKGQGSIAHDKHEQANQYVALAEIGEGVWLRVGPYNLCIQRLDSGKSQLVLIEAFTSGYEIGVEPLARLELHERSAAIYAAGAEAIERVSEGA